MFHGLALSLLALAMVTPPGKPAVPEALEQNMAACESAEAPPEAIIPACNALIQFDRFDRDDQAAIFFDLGRAWHLKGDYDRAVANYDRALALNPGFAWAWYDRGLADSSKGNFGRALADYDAAIRVAPRDSRAFENRGVARYGMKDDDRAIAALREAIKASTEETAAMDLLAESLLRKARKTNASALLLEAAEIGETDGARENRGAGGSGKSRRERIVCGASLGAVRNAG